jgi:hypothetical protein
MPKIRFSPSSRLLTTAAFAGLFLSQAAWANGHCGKSEGGHRGRGHGARFFDTADANKDRKLEKAEAQKMAEARFAQVDTSQDGAITREEMHAALQHMKKGPLRPTSTRAWRRGRRRKVSWAVHL